jgi:DNA-binding response OmpR family regulator
MYQSSVLLIESNHDTLNLISQNIQMEGAVVQAFNNASSAYEYLQGHTPDLVLTDWISSALNGLELCKIMKRSKKMAHIPVVIMADRDSEIDAVTALEVGAEDYIRKPILVRELLTRLKKIIQRKQDLNPFSTIVVPPPTESEMTKTEDIIQLKGIKLNTSSHKAFLQNLEIELTYSEFRLLELFLVHPGRVFQRNAIIEKINGIDYYATERSVDVLVVGLRKKLGEFKKHLETVRGVGYRFSDRVA